MLLDGEVARTFVKHGLKGVSNYTGIEIWTHSSPTDMTDITAKSNSIGGVL
jgi:hypothetical protein